MMVFLALKLSRLLILPAHRSSHPCQSFHIYDNYSVAYSLLNSILKVLQLNDALWYLNYLLGKRNPDNSIQGKGFLTTHVASDIS
uniref:Putative secreted protein n=1 Tax=Panstrongylus lignarius TaxID=156445 RepID=A0A224Y4J9_9HEMI